MPSSPQTESEAYKLAFQDPDFLLREELRPVRFQLELLKPAPNDYDPASHIRFYQTTGQATPKDGWAFAPWGPPADDAPGWRKMPKALPSQPAWLKASFSVDNTAAPLWLEPDGLSKGRACLNGHDLGRYWVQTRERKQVLQDNRIRLPEPWLKTDQPNVLMFFDEHGRTPGKCRLIYST